MIDANSRLMDDFIHKRGSFSETVLKHYVDRNDVRSVRYHQTAAKEILDRATTEDCSLEKKRLIKLVDWHVRQVDFVLSKYE